MSKTFIVLILVLFVLVGASFFFVLRWGSQLPSPAKSGASTPSAQTPPPPPLPSVTVSEEDTESGNTILIKWANLPNGATELEIFRSPKGKNDWKLWQTVELTGDDLLNGSATFNIGNANDSNYDFYTEAVGTGGNGGTVNVTSTLWTSNPTPPAPAEPTSISPSGPTNNGTPPPGNTTTTPTSTGNEPPPVTPPTNPTSTNPGTNPTPSGTPYYNPQVQVLSYGQNPTANFWVQHVEQTIQVGWQNLPSITTSILISRSTSAGGPWSPLLAQANPGETGSYSIQVVDNTVNQPYYYLMEADAGSTTVGTYGPVYLPPVGQ